MVKRHQRQADGLYHVGGKTFKLLRGTRAQVWHGTALETQGRLRKDQLMMNKQEKRIYLIKIKKLKWTLVMK